jgi:antitoxin ParD1/3/4
MALNIPPEFERAVLDRVASGQYESTDDVLYACVSALEDFESRPHDDLERLRAALQIGIEQADRGELVPGEEAYSRIREKLDRAAAVRAKHPRNEVREDPPGMLSIPHDVERAVLERIPQYGTPGDVLLASLIALEAEEQEEAIKLEELRRDIEHGFQQIERGECSTAEEVYLRLRAKLEAKERV